MFCSKCGSENLEGTKFCVNCGEALSNMDDSSVNQADSRNKCKEHGSETKPEEVASLRDKKKTIADDRNAEMEPGVKVNHRKAYFKKRIIIAAIVILLIVIANHFLNGGDKEYIDMVKNGSMSQYGTTVGDILDKNYEKIKWSHRKTDGGIHIVTAAFTGTYLDVPTDFKVNFAVDKEEGTFYLDNVIMNDEESDGLAELAFTLILAGEE